MLPFQFKTFSLLPDEAINPFFDKRDNNHGRSHRFGDMGLCTNAAIRLQLPAFGGYTVHPHGGALH